MAVIDSFCAKDTYELGEKIGQMAKPGMVISLTGDLGVGKTVFTQGLAKGLGIEEPVNSPTFTIVQVYEEGRLPLYQMCIRDRFRTGCKLAVVDPTGKVLDTVVIYPTAPQNKVKEAKATLKKLIEKYHITLISLGNGTASRESEQVIVELLKEIPEKIQYVIVSESGASVYSASKLATEEFPNFDVGQRSAASIARLSLIHI